jgi:simple sugar transport system ATP-binding protein
MPIDPDRLVEMMFGKVIAKPEKPEMPLGDPMLTLDGVTIIDRSTHIADLTLSVAAGEVVGLAGLEGSGQRPLLQACAGLIELTAGTLRVGDHVLTRAGYRDHLAAGVHYLPAGRLEEGLVAGMSIEDHFVLTRETDRFIIDRGQADEISVEKIDEYHI